MRKKHGSKVIQKIRGWYSCQMKNCNEKDSNESISTQQKTSNKGKNRCETLIIPNLFRKKSFIGGYRRLHIAQRRNITCNHLMMKGRGWWNCGKKPINHGDAQPLQYFLVGVTVERPPPSVGHEPSRAQVIAGPPWLVVEHSNIDLKLMLRDCAKKSNSSQQDRSSHFSSPQDGKSQIDSPPHIVGVKSQYVYWDHQNRRCHPEFDEVARGREWLLRTKRSQSRNFETRKRQLQQTRKQHLQQTRKLEKRHGGRNKSHSRWKG